MPDSPRIKLARILYYLLHHPNGISFTALSEIYEINSERTRTDIILALQDIPELSDDNNKTRVDVTGQGEGRRVYLKPFDADQTTGSVENVISLSFALSMLQFLKGTELEKPMENIYNSLHKGENRNLFLNWDKKVFSIIERPKDYSKKSQVIRDCLHSLIQQKCLMINYKASKKTSPDKHTLQIFSLVQFRNGLHLVGKTEKGSKILTFNVERITKSERTGKVFHYPPDYSPKDYFKDAFGLMRSKGERYNVVIRFDKQVADLVTVRKWHKSSTTEQLKDGSVELKMTVSALEQVVPLVLEFGKMAKAIKPKKLVDMVKKEVQIMSKTYNLL